MRVALCQLNPILGDFEGNCAHIVDRARRARDQSADLVVFPELTLSGYPPRDLLERPAFVRQQLDALEELTHSLPADLTVLVGFTEPRQGPVGRDLYNSVAVIRDRQVQHVLRKRLLPTYDVFDEDRYFEPAEQSEAITVGEKRIGVAVCEDFWCRTDGAAAKINYRQDPVADLQAQGAELLVGLAASPFNLTKPAVRDRRFSELARSHQLPLVFVNQVGGQDDILFDGSSAVYGPDGEVWTRLAFFEEDFAVVDLEPGGPRRPRPEAAAEVALEALTVGTRDYVRKCGFTGALVGLSGGIDSAVTAAIAARALGSDNVTGIAMPTRYSASSSVQDARDLAHALKINFEQVPVDGIFQTYLDTLAPRLDAHAQPDTPHDLTLENLQARIRCATLMAFSNRTGRMLLATSNKSEVAVGYSTLYGDMAGGLAVLSDIPKTFVYELARELNRQAGADVVPRSTLEKAPSAELRPEQRDDDSLPPYDVLDPILERYVEDHRSAEDIIAEGFSEDVVRKVIHLIHTSEHKRRQLAPGLIVTRKAFGPGRRYPIAQRFR